MPKWSRILVGLVGAAIAIPVGGFGLAWWTATPDIGALATGTRMERMQASTQWAGDGFTNPLVQVDAPLADGIAKEFAQTDAVQVPVRTPSVVARTAAEFATLPASGLRVTWFGHSTMLIEQDGTRILVDPVWGPRASPWSSVGPGRFYEMDLALADLPPIDAIIISHDHYDHLDLPTVQALRDQPIRWLVPLGIGAHLEHWGVPADRITELDWWEDTTVGTLTATATPARHFSGRWLDRFRTTLWAGWALTGPEHRVFYSGDTAMFPELTEIGERLGPFDLTMFDAGAYDSTWTDVHLGPEQTVAAHRMVRGKVLLPVHWGMFDLANHGWTEPIERVRAAAARFDIDVRSPKPGGSVELGGDGDSAPWWPEEPTQTVESDPIWSTSVESVLDQWWGPR